MARPFTKEALARGLADRIATLEARIEAANRRREVRSDQEPSLVLAIERATAQQDEVHVIALEMGVHDQLCDLIEQEGN